MYEKGSFNTNFPQTGDYRDGTCSFQRYRFIFKQKYKIKKLLRSTSSITLHLSEHQLYKHCCEFCCSSSRGWKLYWCYFRQLYFFSCCFLRYKVGMQNGRRQKRWGGSFFLFAPCSGWMALGVWVWWGVVLVVVLFRAFVLFSFSSVALWQTRWKPGVSFARSYGRDFFSSFLLVLSTLNWIMIRFGWLGSSWKIMVFFCYKVENRFCSIFWYEK